jgi:hypothetical protein
MGALKWLAHAGLIATLAVGFGACKKSSSSGGGAAATSPYDDTAGPFAQDSTNNDIATADLLANDPPGATIADVSSPSSQGGTVVLQNANSIRYTPAAGFNGTDTFTYTGDDAGDAYTATVTVEVTPAGGGGGLLAVDDVATVAENSTDNAINVLANDTLTPGAVIDKVQNPGNGTATISGTSILYTPDPHYNGTDSFTYTIDDGTPSGKSTATVTVTVTPVSTESPIAVNDDGDGSGVDPDTTTDEDTPINIDILGNDTYTTAPAPAYDIPWTVAIETAPLNGMVMLEVDNSVTYTPNPDYNNCTSYPSTTPDTFTYTITDSDGETSTATVSVHVVSVNDTARGRYDLAFTLMNSPVTIDVVANDVGDPTRSVTGTETGDTASDGTVTNNTTDVTYDPDTDFYGFDDFDYNMQDGDAETDSNTMVEVGVLRTADPVAAAPGTRFGISLASLGIDWDDDVDHPVQSSGPAHEFAVGAPGAGDHGEVYIVDGDDGSILWTITPTSTSGDDNRFGTAVAVADDYLYVGMPDYGYTYRNRRGHEGRIEVYNLDDGTYTGYAWNNPYFGSYGYKGDNFGSIIVPFEYGGGYGIVVGVPEHGANYSSGINNRGMVWWAYSTGGSYNYSYIEGSEGDMLGASIAIADVVDGGSSGSYPDVIVGVPGREQDGEAEAGEVRVYVWSGSTLSLSQTLVSPEPTAGDRFGSAVAAGDLGDGDKAEVVVGAPNADAYGIENSGMVYVFDVDDALPAAEVPNPDPDADDLFGSALAHDGGMLFLAGAPGNDVGAVPDSGTVYGFALDLAGAGDPYRVCTFDNPEPNQAYDNFGNVLYFGFDGSVGFGVPMADANPTAQDTGTIYFIPVAP